MKNILKIATVLLIVIFTFSCDNDDAPTTEAIPPITCSVHGLYYKIDGGAQQFLPESHSGINTNMYTHSSGTLGNTLMVHQLGNGYVFQSNATDVDQSSSHVLGILTEGSQLSIGNLWSNTDVVNITYTRKRLDDAVNGVVYYSFIGDYTTASVTYQLEGYVCVTLDVIN